MPILAFEQATPPARTPWDVDEALTFSLHRTSDPDDVLVLDGPYSVQIGVQNLDGPALNLLTSTPAGWDGDSLDDLTAEPIEIFLPLLVDGDTLEGLRAAKQLLRDFTNPRRGPVTLRVTRPNGGYRQITGVRSQPIGGTLDDGAWAVKWQKLGLTLHCSDPFWVEPDTAWDVSWSVRADAGSPLPVLPVAPGASQALNDTNDVTVYGDVETYPVWRVTGPLEAVTVTDVARGLAWTLTASIASDETWIVDCRKGRQGVFDATGNRSRGNLSADAYLWGLTPGVSRVTTVVTGASAGASIVGSAPSRWEAY